MTTSAESPSSGKDPRTTDERAEASGDALPRRSVLVTFISAVLSFLLVAIPSAIGGLFYLDPILRRKSSGTTAGGGNARKDGAGFIRLDVTADTIPTDGTPVAVTVRDDHTDAWNFFRDERVGSVWLRVADATGTIVALNSVCPHLGCSVNFRRSQSDFFCPCHTSSFDLEGQRTNQVPPRGMDTLEVSRRTDGIEDPAGAEIWVKFQNFRRATPEKIPL